MNYKKIVLTGGPGTGKSTLINHLLKNGYSCLPEISREIILEARKKGIDQLFLDQPILFSEMLLEGRIKQFHEEKQTQHPWVFYDRGVFDVLAYLDLFGTKIPQEMLEKCKDIVYDTVFVLPPWKDIFLPDSERYESYEEAVKIHEALIETYTSYNYKLVEVPQMDVDNRMHFVLNYLNETI